MQTPCAEHLDVQVRKSLEEDPAWKHVLRLKGNMEVGGMCVFVCVFWVTLPKVAYIDYGGNFFKSVIKRIG